MLEGESRKAVTQLDRAWQLRKTHLGANHRDTLKTLDELALQSWRIDSVRAEELLQEAVRLRRLNSGPKNSEGFAQALLTQALFYSKDRPEQAIPILEELVALPRTQSVAKDDLTLISALYGLGEMFAKTHRFVDAVRVRQEYIDFCRPMPQPKPVAAPPKKLDAELEELLAILDQFERLEKQFGPNEESLMKELHEHGEFLLRVEHPKEAEKALGECLALREKLQADHWLRFETMNLLGATFEAQKKLHDAEPLLLRGYEGMKERSSKIPADSIYRLTQAGERLAKLFEATGRPAEAVRLRKELPGKLPAKTKAK
jgi:hypothetical protein